MHAIWKLAEIILLKNITSGTRLFLTEVSVVLLIICIFQIETWVLLIQVLPEYACSLDQEAWCNRAEKRQNNFGRVAQVPEPRITVHVGKFEIPQFFHTHEIKKKYKKKAVVFDPKNNMKYHT